MEVQFLVTRINNQLPKSQKLHSTPSKRCTLTFYLSEMNSTSRRVSQVYTLTQKLSSIIKVFRTGSIFCIFRIHQKPLQSGLTTLSHRSCIINKNMINEAVEKQPCCQCRASLSPTEAESGEERASDSVCKVSVRDDFFPVTDGKIAFEIYLSQCAKAFGQNLKASLLSGP